MPGCDNCLSSTSRQRKAHPTIKHAHNNDRRCSGLVLRLLGVTDRRSTAVAVAMSSFERAAGPQTVPPSACAEPKTPLRGKTFPQALRRSGYVNEEAFPFMVTSMRSLAFVANLDGLKFLLDSGTVDFLIVSWLLGDGGGKLPPASHCSSLFRRPLFTTRSGIPKSRY